MEYQYEVLVLGGGPAGVTAALRARELGARVALVERGRLGGTCTNDGCVPTRALAKAARLARDARQFGEYGFQETVPQVDFRDLLSRTQQIVYQVHEKKQLLNALVDAGVKVYPDVGRAAFASPHAIQLGDGARVSAEKIILCVGGHARRLAFPGAEHALTHSDVWGLKRLPGSVAIIGAAATGCQLASIFAAFGSQVWLLEAAPRILAGEDDAVSQVVSYEFERRGLQVLCNIQAIRRISKTSDGYRLEISHTGRPDPIDVDCVLMAVGWPGSLEDLNLGAAGVGDQSGYIVVDDYMRTSVEHIFAAGDVTGRMGLVQRAGYDARIAAENAVLGLKHPYRHQIVPHGGFTDPEYGSVGLTEADARAQEEVIVAQVPFANLDRAVIDARTAGFCKLIVSTRTHRFIGAHVVGEEALEIIHIVATAMAAGMRVEQMAELELAYPTYCASVGLAARQIVRRMGVTPLAPEWRALGKSYTPEWERREQN